MLKTIIVTVGLGVAAAISIVLLVIDWSVPHSQQTGYFAVATMQRGNLSHLDAWNREAKAKYGPEASISLHGRNWVTVVGDKVVDDTPRPLTSSLDGFVGVLRVSKVESFPFELPVDPKNTARWGQTNDKVRHRFEGHVPAEVLEFGGREWRPVHCHSPKPPEFGFPLFESALRVDASVICLMRSEDDEDAHTALVGFAGVDASFWVRPLSRRICRILSASWIEAMMSQPDVKRPDYVACMLARKGAVDEREIMTARFFEVREDKTLAVFE